MASPQPERAETDDGFVGRDPESVVADSGVTVGEDGAEISPVSTEEKQEGVRRIEGITSAWTPWALIVGYAGLFLLSIAISLEQATASSLYIVATSAFSSHSLVSTVAVVQGVVQAVVKAPLAKIADVIGRHEAFFIVIGLVVLGYIQMASSHNIQTFAAAQIFYSAGQSGIQVVSQVFIADTSDLLNRAMFSTIPDAPFIATVWLGPLIGLALETKWRWGYGIWALIVPVAFAPLALSMYINQRKAAKQGMIGGSRYTGLGSFKQFRSSAKRLFWDIDTIGVLLLSGAFALILIPLTIAGKMNKYEGWKSPAFIVMVLLGVACLIAFPFWEGRKKLAPYPLIPLHLLRERTFTCGCILAFFYFMPFYIAVYPYYTSYLLVVTDRNIKTASYITNIFSLASTVSSFGIGAVMKFTGRYRYNIVFGCVLYTLSMGLMYHFNNIHATTGQHVGPMIMMGVGGGIINVSTQLGIQASVKHQHVAAATASFLVGIELGGAVGAAISGAVWNKMVPAGLAMYLPDDLKEIGVEIFASVMVASGNYPMGSLERTATMLAYNDARGVLLIIAICVTIPLIPLALCMKNYDLRGLNHTAVKGRVIGGRADEKERVIVEEKPSFWNKYLRSRMEKTGENGKTVSVYEAPETMEMVDRVGTQHVGEEMQK